MENSRILITGSNGQLGIALKQHYLNSQALDREILDISKWEVVMAYDWSNVDVIINAAAYTNVDDAESAQGREAAWQANALGTANLAKIATQHNKILVHISSEYVFDGTKYPHTEMEPFTPLGVYAQTKAAADIAASTAPQHYILRTSWVIGDGKNFVQTMMMLAEKNISPAVVADQIGRLTFTSVLVSAIDYLLNTKASYGTYNVSNDGQAVSWAEITRTIFKELGRDDLSVTDTTTAAYFKDKPEAAPRPLHSEMSLGKIKAAGLSLPDWQTDLRSYIATEKAKRQIT